MKRYLASRDSDIGQTYARRDPFPTTRSKHHVKFVKHNAKIWYAHCKCGWSGWSKYFDRLTARAVDHGGSSWSVSDGK